MSKYSDFNPDMVPGPCYLCGGPSTYDGISHTVSCDDPGCNQYYQNAQLCHAAVIRHWNNLPSHELKLAMTRAEKAESESASLREQVAKLEADRDRLAGVVGKMRDAIQATLAWLHPESMLEGHGALPYVRMMQDALHPAEKPQGGSDA